MSQPLTHSALAALVSGTLRSGDPDALVHGLNSLSEAQPGEVSFLGNTRYLPQLATTLATAVLVTPEHSTPVEGKALIEVANPTLAFSAVITHFGVKPQSVEPGIHPSASIHPSAKVHPTASHRRGRCHHRPPLPHLWGSLHRPCRPPWRALRHSRPGSHPGALHPREPRHHTQLQRHRHRWLRL